MSIEELIKFMYTNIYILNDIDRYKNIISMNKPINRYDSVNRILIEEQYPKASDIRTADEWELFGRKIKKDAKKIYLIIPNYTTEYISNLSNKPIGDIFNSEELTKALQYNIIHRHDNVNGVDVKPAYDVFDTYSIDGSKYKNNKIALKSSNVITMLKNVTKCEVLISYENRYDARGEKIYIKRGNYFDIVDSAFYLLNQFFDDDKIINFYKSILNLDPSQDEIKLIRSSFKYSLATLLNSTRLLSQSGIKDVNKLDTDKLLNIINVETSIILDIIVNLSTNDKNSTIYDATEDINIVKEAEYVLNVIAAYRVYKMIY